VRNDKTCSGVWATYQPTFASALGNLRNLSKPPEFQAQSWGAKRLWRRSLQRESLGLERVGLHPDAAELPCGEGSAVNILEAIDDPNLLGASIRDPDSWKSWRALLAATFGLPLLRRNWLFIGPARGGGCRLARLPRTCGLWSAGAAANPSP
jgi:hypothetical protein